MELLLHDRVIKTQNEYFFDALTELRRLLEKEEILIECNGSARNVYPSPMQMDMGGRSKAYILYKGQKAKINDVVDIFDYNSDLDFVRISEQIEFHREWLASFGD